MKFGVSTASFFPAYTEDAVDFLAESGVPAAEIFFNSPSELEKNYVLQLKERLDAGGTQVLSVHPFTCAMEPMLLFGEYPRRFQDGLNWYRHYFEAGEILGARYFILHGDVQEGRLPDEQYFERFAALDTAAKEYGMRVSQENVAYCRSRSPAFLAKMKKALPDAAFTLDLKQARRSGADWREILTLLGKNIRHIHMSGCSETEDCLPLTRGNFDCLEFLKALQKTGFDGGIVMELYRRNYGGYAELLASAAMMEKCFRQVSVLENHTET